MNSRLLAAFAIGLGGWLGVGVLRLSEDALFGAALVIGAVAAAAVGRRLALLALLLGMLASYPVALALGVIAFLGENWTPTVALFLAVASGGFVGWLTCVRVVQATMRRPA